MSSVRVGSYALLLNSHVTSHIKPILGWNCGGGGEDLYNITKGLSTAEGGRGHVTTYMYIIHHNSNGRAG